MKLLEKAKSSQYFLHETKRNVLARFLIVLFVFLGYFTFVAYKYGIQNGFLIAFLSWSFFVFCTPIADAGFLLDFPIRVLTGIRMWKSEIIVWVIASLLNIYALLMHPSIYEKTKLLIAFKYILTHPIPFWSIILISAAGTYMSVYFGDELLDVAFHHERIKYMKHGKKYMVIVALFLFVMIFVLYDMLINKLGLDVLK